MASTSHFNGINDKNLEQCVVTFLEKIDSMEKSRTPVIGKLLPAPQVELRTLQLWRSIISECLAAFLYLFIVCGAASTSASAGSYPQTVFVTAAASGLTICVLTYCFQNISGAHVNPSISISMAVSRKITPLRGMLFVAAQSGGAIAGTALLYGMYEGSCQLLSFPFYWACFGILVCIFYYNVGPSFQIRIKSDSKDQIGAAKECGVVKRILQFFTLLGIKTAQYISVAEIMERFLKISIRAGTDEGDILLLKQHLSPDPDKRASERTSCAACYQKPITVPAHYGNLNATVSQIPPHMSPWERLSVEFVLTFLIVFTYCVTMNGHRKWLGNSSFCMGFAYLATGLVSMPTLNPVRAFGPAFVMNRWDHHWVFWVGPCFGGVVAVLVYEIIFVTHRKKSRSEISVDGDSASIHSEADTYDDFRKSRPMRTLNPNGFNRHLSTNAGYAYSKERGDPIYEGSRSLYTRSPPLTRANLSRSQSVYTKNPNARPIYPAQSLYPIPQTTPSAQNLHNQQRQGAETIYGTRVNSRDIYGKIPGRQDSIYGTKKPDPNESYNYNANGNNKIPQTHRKESTTAGPVGGHYYHNQPSPSSHSQYLP